MMNTFNNKPLDLNLGNISKPTPDVWFSNNIRTNIDLNGYAQGETTSQGFSPVVVQPGGMPAIGTLNVGADEVAGLYSGTFNIIVDYN